MVEHTTARVSKAFKTNLLRIAKEKKTSLIQMTYNLDKELIKNDELLQRIIRKEKQAKKY